MKLELKLGMILIYTYRVREIYLPYFKLSPVLRKWTKASDNYCSIFLMSYRSFFLIRPVTIMAQTVAYSVFAIETFLKTGEFLIAAQSFSFLFHVTLELCYSELKIDNAMGRKAPPPPNNQKDSFHQKVAEMPSDMTLSRFVDLQNDDRKCCIWKKR